MDIFTKLRIQIRERLNPIFAPIRKRKIKNPETLTILSNNCWGGACLSLFRDSL